MVAYGINTNLQMDIHLSSGPGQGGQPVPAGCVTVRLPISESMPT